jgi:isochorismate synthase
MRPGLIYLLAPKSFVRIVMFPSLQVHASASRLLSSRQDSPRFILTGESHTLETHGARLVLAQPVGRGLIEAASRVLETAGPDGLLAGVLPFDRQAPARLVLPEETLRTRRFSADRRGAPESGLPRTAARAIVPVRVTESPTRETYQESVGRALAHLASPPADGRPALTKVVLARTLEVEAAAPIDPMDVFARLPVDTNASAFCVTLPPRDHGALRTLVGASPELLIEKRGAKIASRPMAGSAIRLADPTADRQTAFALTQSAKDRHEHRVVVEHVLDVLAPHCRRLRAPESPVLASTATMWHLATPVDGELKREISSLELAAALHPTPAVCGTPTEEAGAVIADLESFDRGYFTGAVGWCDASGDGRWMVTIRCAEIVGSIARLYAGAGIVAGSDPAAEADETGAKFRTLLRALGVEEHARPLANADARPLP